MCCRNRANKRAQQSFAASAASRQFNNTDLGPALPQYTPHDPHPVGAAGTPPVIVVEPPQSRCCRRRCHSPLIWRLGKFVYFRAQQQREKRQMSEAQEQGFVALVSADFGRQVHHLATEMPPSYDGATRALAAEKETWVDGKTA